MAQQAESRVATVDDLPSAEERRSAFDFGNLLGLAFAGFVVVGVVILVTYGLFDKSAPAGPTILSKQAPDFSIDLFGGGSLTLSDMEGQPVIVNIWASWCPICRRDMLTFEKVWREYQEQGIVFVGVNVKDNDEDATALLEALSITYPNGADRGEEIYEAYEATGVPETFFIDRDGIVVGKFIGPVTEVQLTTLAEDLLREE